MFPGFRKPFRLAWAILAIGLLLRIVSFTHGLPEVNEEATPVRQAWEMWDWETGSIDLNPDFFNYPALTFYINFAGQAVYRVFADPSNWADWTPSGAPPLDAVVIGRLIGTLLALLTAAATFWLGRVFLPAIWAAWAAVILFWMPTLFHYSLLSVVDLPLAFFSSFFLAVLVRMRAEASLNDYLVIGVLVGLATASKYTGFFLAVPYLIRLIILHRGNVQATFLQPGPWVGGLAAIAIFFVINPYILLDYETAQWHFAFEREHMTVGHFGRRKGPFEEYTGVLWLNIGPVLVAALLVGLYDIIRRSPATWAPLLVFTATYLAFLLVWSTSFGHYLFPIFPILVLVACQGIRVGLVALRQRIRVPRARLILLVAALAPLVVAVRAELVRFHAPAPKTLAREWFEDQKIDQVLVAAEHGGPTLPSSIPQVLIPLHTTDPAQSSPTYSPAWYASFDYFILVEGVESRYRNESDRFPDQVHLYEHLERDWEMVAHVGPQNKGIRIYRNDAAGRHAIQSYPDTLYSRLGGMSRVLAGRFLDRLGQALRDANRLPFAGAVYNRLVSNLPDEQDYTLSYAHVLTSMGHTPLAIRLLESRREKGDDHLRASLHFLKAEYDSAAAAWATYADAHPGNTRVRVNLARVFLSLGRNQKALTWFLEAVRAEVDNPEVYVNASLLLVRERKDRKQAAEIAKAGVSRWPNHAKLRQIHEQLSR